MSNICDSSAIAVDAFQAQCGGERIDTTPQAQLSEVMGASSPLLARGRCRRCATAGRIRMPFRKPLLLGEGRPDGAQVSSGASEVLAAFVASLATMWGNHDDKALRLDMCLGFVVAAGECCALSAMSVWIFAG